MVVTPDQTTLDFGQNNKCLEAVQKTVHRKRIPTWLRWIGWLGFGLLSLAFMLVVARWWMMYSGHQRTMEILKQGRKFPLVSKSDAMLQKPTSLVLTKSGDSNGTPLASLPFFGTVLTGDEETWRNFRKILEEINRFRGNRYDRPEIVNGVRSFRAVLQNMGINVPDAMTEAEAAAEFLKQADHFSEWFAQWRESVAKGPLDPGGEVDWKKNPGMFRFASLAHDVTPLLAMISEAHLATGDPVSAWSDLQAIKNSVDRVNELFSPDMNYGTTSKSAMFDIAWSGLRSGSWTDDQLKELSSLMARENALDSARQGQEREKDYLTDYFNRFQARDEEVIGNFLKTSSPVDHWFNQAMLAFTTEQQLQDNLALMCHRVDQRLGCFDPDTGFYIRPSSKDQFASDESHFAPDFMNSAYFFFSKHGDDSSGNWAASSVIRKQSEYDEFRIAAALELQRRATGDYPETLDAVSGTFGGAIPRDVATGQPYHYRRSEDGGYTLWGTGIDGKSDGGDKRADITWTHRPAKK